MSSQVDVVRAGFPVVADSSGYELLSGDYEFLGISSAAAWACHDRRSPLGFSGDHFAYFVSDLREALQAQGLHDADVRIQGSSATFFSGAHKSFPSTAADRANLFLDEQGRVWSALEYDKIERRVAKQWGGRFPVQRPFDAMFVLGISPEPSDIDVQISSDEAFKFARRTVQLRGGDPEAIRFTNSSYNFMRKSISDTEFLYLNRWVAQWEPVLDRGVNIAIFDSAGPPMTGTEMSSHFRDTDWVARVPGAGRDE